jgi:hypothetical protein
MTKLSDNRVGDRLHAALEMIGTEEGETVRGNTALIAARQSLSLLKQGLLIAAERNSDHVSIVMNQLSSRPRRPDGLGPRRRGSGIGSSNGRFQPVGTLSEAMRAVLAQLGDFDSASCLIKADRTHNDGKQSHERPGQRRASGDRASDNPNAKGNDTYRD